MTCQRDHVHISQTLALLLLVQGSGWSEPSAANFPIGCSGPEGSDRNFIIDVTESVPRSLNYSPLSMLSALSGQGMEDLDVN
jgi:hypothetical protein